MMHAAMLAGASALMLVWRPCRSREGRMPRSAVAMLLLSAVGLWAGSLAVVVHLLAEPGAGLVAACGQAWQALRGGALSWPVGVAAAWLVVFPIRAAVRVAGRRRDAGRLRQRLDAGGRPLVGHPRTAVVGDLGTPAVTVGILRPLVAIDTAFWSGASPVERRVVLAHEHAHRRGAHGLLEAAAVWLAAPLPSAIADDLVGCVRRHLEAIADDAAARACGRQQTGRALAELSLAAPALSGLAVAGDGLWRARRLLAPAARTTVLDRLVVQGSGTSVVLCAGFVAVQAGVLAAAGWAVESCPL